MFKSFQPTLLQPDYAKYATTHGRGELAAQCRAKVVQWRWASGEMSLQEPFRKEQSRENPQWLKPGAKPELNEQSSSESS